MDTITPTPEFLSKGGHWEKPTTDQRTNRAAYRKLSVFESLHQAGKISDGAKLASDKLVKHIIGATGVNVGSGGGLNPSDMVEFPAIYHGQKVAEMKAVVDSPVQWAALVAIVEETKTLEQLGAAWLNTGSRPQSYIAGLALIRMGLDTIATHYGMDTGYHARASP
jgi:hypothetical protein